LIFRGHGESEGRSEEVTIAGEVIDLENSINIFKSKIDNSLKITFIASSFGAVSSILYISKNERCNRKISFVESCIGFLKRLF